MEPPPAPMVVMSIMGVLSGQSPIRPRPVTACSPCWMAARVSPRWARPCVVPPRSLVVGLPGKVIRTLTDADIAAIRASADGYVNKIRLYL